MSAVVITYTLGNDWTPPKRPTMAAIAQHAASRHGLSVADLRGPATNRPIARARHEAMWLMAETGRWSLFQIGRYLGGRDHTTVRHGILRHSERKQVKEAA